MYKSLNVVQFLPYFPPHKWWLETHADEWWKAWFNKSYWKVYNVITDIEQSNLLWEEIKYKWEVIWYISDWIYNLVSPSIEIIPNFPTYKPWTKKYKLITSYLEEKNIDIVISRTRFFLTSLSWWLFANKNNIRWCHIEHWSSYVKLNSNFKSVIAKLYDMTIWKWVFKKSDMLVWVSNACKNFINENFNDRDVTVIYRWFDFINMDLSSVNEEILSQKFNWKIIVWFVWRLYKWKNVESLLKAFLLLDNDMKNKIQIVVIWDWEDYERLKEIDSKGQIYFTWWKLFKYALKLQSQFDIHFHTSSPGWWLAWTLVQWMNFAKIVVSTPYEWAKEIIANNQNWILLKDDSIEEMKKWLIEWIKLFEEWKSHKEANKVILKKEFSWDENIIKYYKLFNNEK